MELSVGFVVLDTSVFVEKRFDSYAECRKFVGKVRRSKKLRLVSHPDFR